MSESLLLKTFDLMATVPGGVTRLRELLISLAVQGKLLPQNKSDEPATLFLSSIRAAREALVFIGKVKRDKPIPEITASEIPYNLPPGWKWVRLNALLQKIGAGSTPLGGREVYVAKGVKFLRSQNVWNDGLKLQGVAYIKPETHAKMSGTVVMPNDLLFNITGASIGRCAIVPGDFDEANVSQHVTIIRPALPTLTPFLHLVLISRHVQQTVMDVQVGVSREGLSIAKLGNFVIPLPPLAEQARIVARVEELMKLCDALEQNGRLADEQHARLTTTLFGALAASESAQDLAENWQRVAESFDLLLDRPEAVEALEQTITQLAVGGLLSTQSPRDVPVSIGDREQSISEIPATWSRIALEDVLLELRYGTSVKCGYEVKGKPVLRIPNLKGGAVDTADLKFGVLDEREMVKLRLEKGDILVIRSNGSASLVGSTAIVDAESEGFAFAGYLMRLRLRREFIEPSYLVLVMQTLEIRSQIEAPIRTTSGVKNINSTEVSRLTFSLPPLAEQSRILLQVAFLHRACTDLRQQLATARQRQSQLSQALLEQQSVATI